MWRIKKKIGIIGFGNMGSAIAQRIKAKYKVFIFDKDKEKTKNLKDIKVTDTLVSLVEQSDVVILAVKPQDYDVVLHELKGIVKNKLIISIAAGIPTELIEKVLGNIRVIRAMPNLPARVGNGITYLCKGHFTRARDLRFAQLLFKNMGTTFIALEDIMSEVTAASGSGPGFWCHEVSGIPKD
jgi:pyrroline-5-carboxylate reductase